MGSRESGSRPKYNAAVHAKIVDALKRGAFKSHAAQAANIAPRTFETWLEDGRAGVEPYVQLAQDVDRVIADDAIRNQTIITKAALGKHEGDWKAAAWNLERKFPKLYGAMSAGHESHAQSERPFSPWKLPNAADNTTKAS